MKKSEKCIKVLSHPDTWIFVDANVPEEKAKEDWMKKHWTMNKSLSLEQILRGKESIKQAKIEQRKHGRTKSDN